MGFNLFKKEKPNEDITVDTAPAREPAVMDTKEMGEVNDKTHDTSDTVPEVSSKYQAGIRNVEAVTTVWKRRDIVIAYGM